MESSSSADLTACLVECSCALLTGHGVACDVRNGLVQASRARPSRVGPEERLGSWIWKLDGVRRLPYRLPDSIARVAVGRPVFVMEGEKDVEALTKGRRGRHVLPDGRPQVAC